MKATKSRARGRNGRPVLTLAAAAGLLTAGCGEGGAGGADGGAAVEIDGSSTVYPITAAFAEEFQLAQEGTRVTVGVSGTGGGFKRFCAGETDISNASREISEVELQACEAAGVEPIEVPVAWDGLTVAVNPENDWARCITVEELRRLWQPGSTIQRWSQIRDSWPDTEITLYGPDTDSGTFDYFTEAIVGEEDASRSDYAASADDNVLVRGVAGDPGALGYFGFAYYEENREQIKALEVDPGGGCVAPTRENIESGRYEPLSRLLYIYVKEGSLQDTTVRRFVEFYLQHAPELVPQVGYVALDSARYQRMLESLRAGKLGEPGYGVPGARDTAGVGADTTADPDTAAGADTAGPAGTASGEAVGAEGSGPEAGGA